ncbi:MAG TPA: ABC transporter permease [Calditrichia bacterium]|nr:ABC transporter permease [Calditrichia bacterium]
MAPRKRVLALLLSGLLVLPVLYLVLLSLAREWRFPAVMPPVITLQNWVSLFTVERSLLESLLLSLVISVSVAIVVTAASFLISRRIAYHPRRDRLLLLCYLPYILSPVIYAACLYFYFVKLKLAGSLGGVLIGQLAITFPFGLIVFTSYWNHHLKNLEELVATLGGNPLQTLWRVLVPVSRGILLVVFFQVFLISWFEYGLTSFLGVGKVQTLTIKVYQYLYEGNIYFSALAACLLILPPTVLFWVNKRFIFRSLA